MFSYQEPTISFNNILPKTKVIALSCFLIDTYFQIKMLLCLRYKGKSYRAIVEVCRTTGQLEAFCRAVCIKLECCPNIISPHNINGQCPENCNQQTKTKYSEWFTTFSNMGIFIICLKFSKYNNGFRKKIDWFKIFLVINFFSNVYPLPFLVKKSWCCKKIYSKWLVF